jgi:hypothetical protein
MGNADAETTIVVGIAPGGRISDGTIQFVTDAATRLDVGVQLVHAVPTQVGGPTGTWDVGVDRSWGGPSHGARAVPRDGCVSCCGRRPGFRSARR